jgi:hypothetical protein
VLQQRQQNITKNEGLQQHEFLFQQQWKQNQLPITNNQSLITKDIFPLESA